MARPSASITFTNTRDCKEVAVNFDKIKFLDSSKHKRDNVQVIAVAIFWVALIAFAIATSAKSPLSTKHAPIRVPKAQQAKFY
jgi:hypothetical protein